MKAGKQSLKSAFEISTFKSRVCKVGDVGITDFAETSLERIFAALIRSIRFAYGCYRRLQQDAVRTGVEQL